MIYRVIDQFNKIFKKLNQNIPPVIMRGTRSQSNQVISIHSKSYNDQKNIGMIQSHNT